MAEKPDQEKTEPASSKKRADARNKGQVAMSREIPSVLILMTSLGFFFFGGAWMVKSMTLFMNSTFSNLNGLIFSDILSARSLLALAIQNALYILLPFMLAVLIAGVSGNVLQVGFLFSTETITPKLTKLNPLTGFRRLFSGKTLAELPKSILKMIIVGTIAYVMVQKNLPRMPDLIQLSVAEIMQEFGWMAFKIGFFVCLALIIMAAADYVFQHWQHEKELRMTKQEVKDEQKQLLGDPQIKARIKSAQRDMARRRMMAAIPAADVVITNPTRLAVALKFDADEMDAPMVVAKGAGEIARKIRELAREHDIPLVEEKPLARALYKTVEIDQFIPVELYRAVAEVLAYVYRLKGKLS
ncbi:MAG: flagellar biosynthesis protein FlhB [Desulfobacterales bacterium]|nr:flagellar biosynthesis protein FlhB [Desulfobacterales bacterium]